MSVAITSAATSGRASAPASPSGGAGQLATAGRAAASPRPSPRAISARCRSSGGRVVRRPAPRRWVRRGSSSCVSVFPMRVDPAGVPARWAGSSVTGKPCGSHGRSVTSRRGEAGEGGPRIGPGQRRRRRRGRTGGCAGPGRCTLAVAGHRDLGEPAAARRSAWPGSPTRCGWRSARSASLAFAVAQAAVLVRGGHALAGTSGGGAAPSSASPRGGADACRWSARWRPAPGRPGPGSAPR